MNTLSFAAALIAIILPIHLAHGLLSISFPSFPQIYTLFVSSMLDVYQARQVQENWNEQGKEILTIPQRAYSRQILVLIISSDQTRTSNLAG